MSELLFETLPLAAPIHRALSEKGYEQMTPIQAAGIPIVLNGRDLLACAQTGTGKTAAFALPMLHHLSELPGRPERHEVRSVILTPTRELAVQVMESFRQYGKHLRLKVGIVHGGVSMRPQIKALTQGLDVLVATPGRFLDLYNQGFMDLSQVNRFVLDEADRMLDMGFIHDIRKIAAKLPKKRQTLFFSATMGPEISKLAASLLNDPEEVRIAPKMKTADNIDHGVLFVQNGDKQALLFDLMNKREEAHKDTQLSLIFSRTKHGANKLAEKLNRAGIRADAIHGNKTQAARQKTLNRFREGRVPVLVATDVAARGIDVRNITLVVNYDLPAEPDNYVHRIGRTARAGASGRAVSFCSGDDFNLLRSVERMLKQTITVENDHAFHAESLESRYRQNPRQGGGGGQNRKPQGRGRFRSTRQGSPAGKKRGFQSQRSR